MPLLNIDDFDKLNIYCFDLGQYNQNSDELVCTIFVNYKNKLFYQELQVLAKYYFEWDDYKWILYKNLEQIKYEGLVRIMQFIKNGN